MQQNSDVALSFLINQDQYLRMSNEIEDLEKIVQQFKKFFDEILNRKNEFCTTNIEQSKQLLDKLKNQSNIQIEDNLAILGQQCQQLFVNLQNSNASQLGQLQLFSQECKQLINKFMRYKDEYILSGLKFYKNDQLELNKLMDNLAQKKQQYEEALMLYKQSQTDPSLLYNFDLKQKRFNTVNHKISKIKDCQFSIQTTVEILNSRRKSLCIDLLELKKIVEELFSMMYFNTYQLTKRNIQYIIRVCQNQQHIHKRIKKQSFYSILPEQQKFNFEKGSSRMADFQFLEEQRKLDFDVEVDSNIDEFENRSFRSLKSSLNQSTTSIDDQTSRLPQFLTLDVSQLAYSQIVQYQEWLRAYLKQVQDNCIRVNQSIVSLSTFVSNLISSFKKQGKPCIALPDQKITQSPLNQLKWFKQYQQFFGDIGVQSLQAQTQINDLFNLFVMQLSVFMRPKQESIVHLHSQLVHQQNITFSSLEKQIKDLQIIQQQYLKHEGLIINNRTVSLSFMDSQQKSNQNQYERQFRQMITTTSKATCHLLLELEKNQNKYIKTIIEIIDAIHQQFVIQLGDVLTFQGFPEVNEQLLIKECKQQSIQYLKRSPNFSILFLKSMHQQSKSQIELFLEDQYNITYSFHNNYQKDFQQLSHPQSICDEDELDRQSQILEQDKDQEEQMVFIKSKMQTEQNEFVHNSFGCALSEKIQLQGRLYITNKRIFFHSNFNSSNLFFGDTILNIPKQDILYIQKRTNAFIFDNSISIKTPKGQIFFATFFSRDLAYDLIIKVFSPKEQPELLSTNVQAIDAIKLVPLNFTPQQLEFLNQRSEKLNLQIVNSNPKNFIEETIFEFPEIPLRLFFKLIFGDKIANQSNTLYERLKISIGCSDFVLTKWSPEIPIEFDAEIGTRSILDCEDFHERFFSCQQPLPKSSIPLMPKVCTCGENQKLQFISMDKFILDMKVKTENAPYCDAFYVTVRYICEQVSGGIKMSCWIDSCFLKKVFVQRIIENASISEITLKTKQFIYPGIRKELANYMAMINGQELQEQQTDQQNEQSLDSQSNFKRKLSKLCKFLINFSMIGIFLALLIHIYIEYLSKMVIKVEFQN